MDVRGPGQATVREWRCPGLSPSRENGHPTETKYQKMPGYGEKHTEGEAETHGDGGPMTGKPPRSLQGPGCRPRMAKGRRKNAGNGGRSRHVARGAAMSSGGWRVAGVGNGQVDDAPRRERK